MKAAPLLRALGMRPKVKQSLVHTGQHYDKSLSGVFFEQLGMPAPDVNLEVGSGSHAWQTAEIMRRFEAVVLERRPDVVVVYGDVNSTLAAALVCAKLVIPVAHVEAGLRSFDRTMPEEINRIVTDSLSEFLFTPSADGDENLGREGVPGKKIFRVGNAMIDTLIRLLPSATRFPKNGFPERYALVTLHRPSNVDDMESLKRIVSSLARLSAQLTVVFPVHPRTRSRIDAFGISTEKLQLLEPLPYIDFLALQKGAQVVITDSGGIQEETTYLGIPCLTLRDNTERPVTITLGTNVLVGRRGETLDAELAKVMAGTSKKSTIPPLWDGHASERIAEILR